MHKRMGEEGFRWFIAVVADVNDPLKLGRVKVRVINEHDDSIPNEDLLWAIPLSPPTSAAYKQIGASPLGLLANSTVIGFYADGHEKQHPLIWGSYFKMPDGTQQSNELPQRSREIDNVKYDQIGPEPKTPYDAKYPFNYSVQSQSGHIIEIDDTSNAERLLARHKNGSYVEMSKDHMVYKASGDAYTIVANNDTIYVGGTVNIHVVGTANVNIDGDATLTAASWTINGDVQLNGALTATGDVTAGSISLENHTHSGVQSGGSSTGKPQ